MPADSAVAKSTVAAQIAARTIGMNSEQQDALFNSPEKLLQLIVAAEGNKGSGAAVGLVRLWRIRLRRGVREQVPERRRGTVPAGRWRDGGAEAQRELTLVETMQSPDVAGPTQQSGIRSSRSARGGSGFDGR